MAINRRPVMGTLAGGALIALLAACQPITTKPGTVTTAPVIATAVATEAVATEAAAADTTASATLSVDEQALVAAAAEQVAQTTNVPAGDVNFVSLEAVEWPDASLGCPQPDMMYAQVITPGYLLLFDAGEQRVEVHTDMSQPPQIVICQP